MTIVEFLAARLSDLEAVVRPLAEPYAFFMDWAALSGREIEYVKAVDPAFLLADIAAKRAIIQIALEIDDVCERLDWSSDLGSDVMRILAAPFADHPDYDSRWAL